jgi:hypothetical protein
MEEVHFDMAIGIICVLKNHSINDNTIEDFKERFSKNILIYYYQLKYNLQKWMCSPEWNQNPQTSHNLILNDMQPNLLME